MAWFIFFGAGRICCTSYWRIFLGHESFFDRGCQNKSTEQLPDLTGDLPESFLSLKIAVLRNVQGRGDGKWSNGNSGGDENDATAAEMDMDAAATPTSPGKQHLPKLNNTGNTQMADLDLEMINVPKSYGEKSYSAKAFPSSQPPLNRTLAAYEMQDNPPQLKATAKLSQMTDRWSSLTAVDAVLRPR